MNAGQMCWAGSLLLVHEDVHDDLVEAVCAEVAKWPVGPGMEEGFGWGVLSMSVIELRCSRNSRPV